MTQQNDGIDFSSILKESEKHSVSKRQNSKFKKHMIVTGIAGTIILMFAIYLIVAFTSKTSFDSDVPLSENISRWTPLNWETDGVSGDSGVPFTALNVDWVPKEGQYFEGTVNSSVCSLRMSKLGNGLGSTDKESTLKYSEEFQRSSSEVYDNSQVWLETTENVKVEFMKSSYVNGEGNPTYSYYRGSPENNGLIMMIVSCEDQESLEELLPDEGGSEVSELAKVKPSAFSPF